jgi:hypothetical protein
MGEVAGGEGLRHRQRSWVRWEICALLFFAKPYRPRMDSEFLFMLIDARCPL